MRADVHASAREFLDRFTGATPRRPTPLQENGFKTLLHETIHNHSPITATVYERAAAAVEETTTELLARRLMRDMFGARGALVAPTLAISRGRSYEREIDLARRVLERELAVTPENAIAMLEDAAVAMRRYNGPKFVNPDDYLRHFVVNLPLPTTVSAADRLPTLMRLVTAFQAAL
jgi:hypothetical protein